jgi:hypothetical protein
MIAQGIEARWRAPLWREEEGSVRKNGAYWFGSYLPDLPVSETTELERGTGPEHVGKRLEIGRRSPVESTK